MAMLTVLECRTGGLLRQVGAVRRSFVRNLSGPEVSTALRPFFFLVHPDLFGKYPNEQTENERSLKILKNYVDTLVHDKKKPNPAEVKFFVRPRGAGGGARKDLLLPSIKIRLRETKLRSTVVTILRSADLPTGYVDNIPERNSEATTETPGVGSDFTDPFEEEAGFTEQSKTGFSSTDKHQPLVGWLQANVDIARVRLTRHEPIRLETERLQGEISYKYDLEDFIKTTPDSDKLLQSLPMWERTLSQALRGIQVVNDPSTIVLVENHRVRLRQLVTAVGDFMSRRSLPSCWPADMSRFKLLAESDSSSMMINDDGVFVLPASTPGFLIVDFITKGLKEADRRMSEWASMEKEEAFLISSCINELGLIQLDKDDNISVRHMVHCCSRLLKFAGKLRHLTHGNHLVVARYYMVKSDGVICLPWDLVIDGLEEAQAEKKEHVLHLTMY